MDVVERHVRQLAAGGEDARQKTIVALQNLAYSLETPHDTIHRYGHMNLQAAVVQVGISLRLFRCLTECDESMTVDKLSDKTGAEPQLMRRVLRYLAAIGAVIETGKDQYSANHVTRNLTERVVEAGLSHYFGTAAPQYQSLPAFLERVKYTDPVDNKLTAFQMAFQTDMDSFTWFAGNPTHLDHFNTYMALRRNSEATWLTVYPVADQAVGWPAEEALYVNIGGGIGHQCAQFRDKYPTLSGRVLLQDLPHSVAQALPTPGVENMAHDMFEAQPITGAKFYHLRAVLHNHPPSKVRQVLRNIKAAMGSESVLLIDEMVFPDKGVSFNAASIDMTMLSAFASTERTETQWRQVFDDVGLELVRTYTYLPLSYESVMDVRLPRAT